MKPMTDSMYELETILKAHGVRYPFMEPTDGVKLIYQNEFGGGHLIRSEETCLAYLRREYAAVPKDPAVPSYEDIGNGIVRVNLSALQEEDLERLGKTFIRSAAAHTGELGSFLQKLEVLRKLTGQGVFSFGSEELEDYLARYAQAGYPAVSHSETYRKHYSPAYRVVLRHLWE